MGTHGSSRRCRASSSWASGPTGARSAARSAPVHTAVAGAAGAVTAADRRRVAAQRQRARVRGGVDETGVASSGERGAEALIDVGAKVTNIVIHQNGVPKFVRILLMGGDNITDAVSERLGVPFDQAVGVKQQLGMSPVRGEINSDHPAARIIETSAGSFVEEVRGSLDYYLAQPTSVPLQRVVLSGGGARLTGLGQRLAAATRLPVEPGAATAALRLGKTGLSDDQLSYVEPQIAVPVGLALGVAS